MKLLPIPASCTIPGCRLHFSSLLVALRSFRGTEGSSQGEPGLEPPCFCCQHVREGSVPTGHCSVPQRSPSAEPKEKLLGMELFPYNYRMEFVCRPGFARNARTSNVLICGVNGMWQGSSDICIRECVLGGRYPCPGVGAR